MTGSLNKKFAYAIFVVFLLIVWLTIANLQDKDIVQESQKLKESASKTIKEGTQKFKERYIENDENTSGKLKEDLKEIGDKFEKGVEKTADMAIEKSREAGQKLLDEGKNIVQKVSDYVDPEEVVSVGFGKAINQETQAASHRINYFSLKKAVKRAIPQKMGIELSCDLPAVMPESVDTDYFSSCNYPLRQFNNSQRRCIAIANDSLLLKSSADNSLAIHLICDSACEQKKAFDSCIEGEDKTREFPQKHLKELARQATRIKNASAEFQCIDNDLVIAELARLRQLVRRCKKDKTCDIKSEAFKQQYADESKRIRYFYDRGRQDLYETYHHDVFIEELNTNSLFKTKHVSRALLTTGVKQREPVDNVCIPMKNKIMFFTEIKNYAGHRVTHRWKYNNKTIFELSFNVRGPRWRVWTSKNIPVKWAGPWVIEVVDEDENILTQKLFYYTR